jgi:hypothetical protein
MKNGTAVNKRILKICPTCVKVGVGSRTQYTTLEKRQLSLTHLDDPENGSLDVPAGCHVHLCQVAQQLLALNTDMVMMIG